MAKALALAAGVLAAALTATLTGCFGGAAAYNCSTNEQCNANGIGTCQPDNLCSYAAADCPSGQRYGDNAGDKSNTCVGQGGGDGGMDDFCYGDPSGLVRPCFAMAPTGDITLPATINTDTSTMCSAPQSGGEGYCVIAANSIRVDDTVAATGSKPLVLVAVTTIDIVNGATLDVASHHSTTPPRAGAGAGSTDCTEGTLPMVDIGGGGGAGGSFGGAGGNGGTGNATTGAGGIPGAVQVATGLRGGCPGQDGINGMFGRGGRGGGAVYLIADTAITIAGAINASGEGGRPGLTGSAGGGGGGSGGMIGLDAPMITNTGDVFANGASGGEGSGSATPGNIGPEPTNANASPPPPSGTNNGGNGGGGSGLGSATGGNASNGSTGPNPGGGGGGGGGLGVIKVFRGTLSGRVSPAPS